MTDLLSDALPPVSREAKRRCVERELSMRKRVYPRWIADGRMKQADADEQIRIMEAIRDDYA